MSETERVRVGESERDRKRKRQRETESVLVMLTQTSWTQHRPFSYVSTSSHHHPFACVVKCLITPCPSGMGHINAKRQNALLKRNNPSMDLPDDHPLKLQRKKRNRQDLELDKLVETHDKL